jgi:hypothetical protein
MLLAAPVTQGLAFGSGWFACLSGRCRHEFSNKRGNISQDFAMQAGLCPGLAKAKLIFINLPELAISR